VRFGFERQLIGWDVRTQEPRISWTIPGPANLAELNWEKKEYRFAGQYLAELDSSQKMTMVGNAAQFSPGQPKIVLRYLSTNGVAIEVTPFRDPESVACTRTVLAAVSRGSTNRVRRIDANSDLMIESWEIATGEPISTLPVWGLTCFALSPNGYTVATSDEATIEIHDGNSDGPAMRWQADAAVRCLSFSDDGHWLASGLANGTVLVWELIRRRDAKGIKLTTADLGTCWRDMRAGAKVAFPSADRLVADPAAAVPFLRQNLKPIEPIDPKRLKALLADLDSSSYDHRESASRKLDALGDRVRPFLERELSKTTSAEVRNRLNRLLATTTFVRSPDRCRHIRALVVLERIGNVDAAAVLADLAKGDPDALETQLASEALRRTQK
jgi:hypothetical protein